MFTNYMFTQVVLAKLTLPFTQHICEELNGLNY